MATRARGVLRPRACPPCPALQRIFGKRRGTKAMSISVLIALENCHESVSTEELGLRSLANPNTESHMNLWTLDRLLLPPAE